MSKYRAVKTVVDGITFASKAEAKRYGELKLLVRHKHANTFIMQERFPLHVGLNKIGDYIADFVVYWADGSKTVEDVKGFKTPLYRWKKKHFEAQYGIAITEITSQKRLKRL